MKLRCCGTPLELRFDTAARLERRTWSPDMGEMRTAQRIVWNVQGTAVADLLFTTPAGARPSTRATARLPHPTVLD
jgi:hypothetical protein